MAHSAMHIVEAKMSRAKLRAKSAGMSRPDSALNEMTPYADDKSAVLYAIEGMNI